LRHDTDAVFRGLWQEVQRWNSVFTLVTRPFDGRPRNRGSILERGFLFSTARIPFLGYTQPRI